MIRVLLVEDHATFRQALAFLLEREPDMTVVAQAGSLGEAREMLEGVDVAVVDVELQGSSGIDIIPEIIMANGNAMVLILTASASPTDIARAVEAGAAGLMSKLAPVEEVVQAVRDMGAGRPLLTPSDAMKLLNAARNRDAESHPSLLVVESLTPREREVLQSLAMGMSDREIAEHLRMGAETVKTHMGKLLSKLGANSRLQALVIGVQNGLVEIKPSGAPTNPR